MPTWVKRHIGPTPQEVAGKIIRYFHKVSRPVYLGEISLEIGFNLPRTESYVDDLVHEGLIRRATKEEIARVDGVTGANVFVLIGPSSVKLAHMP